MVRLLSTGKNLKKISSKYVLLTFFFCISMVAWFGLTDLRADEHEAGFQNAAQAQHADNVARQAALQDDEVVELIELGRYKAARAVYNDRVETFARQIARMRLAGMEWEEITDRYGVHDSVLGLGHSPKTFRDGVYYSKRSDKMLRGRNSQNNLVVFHSDDHNIGDYVNVLIEDCTSATLKGKIIK